MFRPVSSRRRGTARCAPMPWNGCLLSLGARAAEFDERPDLLRSPLPLLDTCEDLDDRVWMRAARVADTAGASDFVRRLLPVRACATWSGRRPVHNSTRGVMLALMEHDPRATVRVVRVTRDPAYDRRRTRARSSAGCISPSRTSSLSAGRLPPGPRPRLQVAQPCGGRRQRQGPRADGEGARRRHRADEGRPPMMRARSSGAIQRPIQAARESFSRAAQWRRTASTSARAGSLHLPRTCTITRSRLTSTVHRSVSR